MGTNIILHHMYKAMFVYKFRQWGKFLRELFFLAGTFFLQIVKKPQKSQNFESGKN